MPKLSSKTNFPFFLLCICVLSACKDTKTHTVLDLFPESHLLSQKHEFHINEDSIALIEGLVSDGEYLIVYDLHSGYSYTLFDGRSGEYIARFGAIGQGPSEILIGCYGYLSERCFTVFSDQARTVMKYSLDSLRSGKANGSPVCLTKYDIADTQLSRLIAIDDDIFVSAGTYQSRYQFLLFDKDNRILDYAVDVYNAADSAFNLYTRFLSNQGDLVMHPQKERFAYSVNLSSNIDLFEIRNNKIVPIKSLRLGNPISEPVVQNEMFYSVRPTESTQTGYINLSATTQYIYALYSDQKLHENGRKSTTVLVFDWNGNPIKKYALDTEVYYIAVDEAGQKMFAAVKNDQDGWSVICYAL